MLQNIRKKRLELMKITDEMIINYLDGELNISDKELFEEELKKKPFFTKTSEVV